MFTQKNLLKNKQEETVLILFKLIQYNRGLRKARSEAAEVSISIITLILLNYELHETI